MNMRWSATDGGRFEYLVKWKDYDASENTWEPESNLTRDDGSRMLLEKFRLERLGAPANTSTFMAGTSTAVTDAVVTEPVEKMKRSAKQTKVYLVF